MLSLLLRPFRHAFDFSGRSSREEYWLFVLASFLLLIVFCAVSIISVDVIPEDLMSLIIRPDGSLGSLGWSLLAEQVVCFIPGLSLTVRRINDVRKSNFFYTLVIVHGVISILLFSFGLFKVFSVVVLGLVFIGCSTIFDSIIFYRVCLPGKKGPNQFGPELAPLYKDAPLTLKEKKASSLMLRPFCRYLDISGRASRKEYWLFFLFLFFLTALSLPIIGLLSSVFSIDQNRFFTCLVIMLGLIFIAILYFVLTVLAVRRLHDTNLSGFWAFISWIPTIGFIIYTILLCRAGTKGENKYGLDPLGRESDKEPEEGAPAVKESLTS